MKKPKRFKINMSGYTANECLYDAVSQSVHKQGYTTITDPVWDQVRTRVRSQIVHHLLLSSREKLT